MPPASLRKIPVEIQIVICGGGPLKDVSKLVDGVLARGWKVQAIATPSARDMGLDVNQLEQQTGRPVMSSWGAPSTRRIGPADGIIVAPATVNTINKLALDIRDNYAAALLGQAVAARIPMVILPSIKKVDTERVIFRNHIENLRREGVSVLLGGPTGIEPTNASSKDGPLPPFPWHLAVSAMALRFPEAETGLSTSWHLIGKIGMSLSTVAFASAAIFLMQSKM